MSTIRKFGPLFNVLTVLRAVFRMVFGLSARFRRGVRAALAKWATVWGLVSRWLGVRAVGLPAKAGRGAGPPRGLPPPRFCGRAPRQSPAPSCRRFLHRVPTICHHLPPVWRPNSPPAPIIHQCPIRMSLQSPASPPDHAGSGRACPATHHQPGGWRAQGAHPNKSDVLKDSGYR